MYWSGLCWSSDRPQSVENPYGEEVRWDDLFADLEGQFAASRAEEFEGVVEELADAEAAEITLAERFAASRGTVVLVDIRNRQTLTGTVVVVAGAWIRLADSPRQFLVKLDAVERVRGLSPKATSLSLVSQRLSLAYALRLLRDDGADVVVATNDGDTRGRITGVGQDFVEIQSATTVTIPLGMVAYVRAG